MKKLLLAVGSILVVAGGGVASAIHYDNYQTNVDQKQAQVVSSEQQALDQVRAEFATYKTEIGVKYEDAQLQCRRGTEAYAKLPTATRNTLEAPVCDPVVTPTP